MFKNQINVLIKCDNHANLDSLPLRYGFTYQPDLGFKSKKLRLFDLGEMVVDPDFSNRRHVLASFEDDNGEIRRGHFILVRNGDFMSSDFINTVPKSQIFVVTVWPEYQNFNEEKELQLSNTLRDMREKKQVTVSDLIEMHPYYLEGRIWTHGDLISVLTDLKVKKRDRNVVDISIQSEKTLSSKSPLNNFDETKPMILKNVYTKVFLNKAGEEINNICLQFEGISTEMRNNWSRGFEKRLKLCESLIGKEVITSTWKSYNSQVWFQSISEYFGPKVSLNQIS